MHNASHYALFYTPRYNNYASMFWTSFSDWNHSMWSYHHVFYHRSCTNTINDSDIHHIVPLFRKHHSQKQGWSPPYLYPLVAFTIPGAFYGQALMYIFWGTLMGILFVSPLKVPRIVILCLIVSSSQSELYCFTRLVYGARSRIWLHVAYSITRTRLVTMTPLKCQ